MSNISAKLVKELRARTSAGMMECKKALVAANGDIEKAAQEMRISGQAKADKKSSRVAAEGVIEAHITDGKAILIEVNSETDFVARDENFKAFVREVVKAAHTASAKDIQQVLEAKISVDENVEQARKSLVAKIGENIQVRRIKTLQAEVLGSYIHHSSKIGVVVALEGGNESLAKDIAMQVVAANPLVVSADDVPADLIAKEKQVFAAQAKESGKPDEIIKKMIDGRIAKFLDEVALLGQAFVKDTSINIGKLVDNKGARVVDFIRLDVGEGIQRQQQDFAAEVMSQIKD